MVLGEPNQVPAWYSRGKPPTRAEGEQRTALQLPEDPACTVFVTCTAESRGAVQAALGER